MKKNKIIGIVCIMLVLLCCLVGCSYDSFNAKKAKTATITATIAHADGVVMQKIESTFTKAGKAYSYVTKTYKLNSLDSGSTSMYATEEKTGESASFNVPSWEKTDFETIFETSKTKLSGTISAQKIESLGITDYIGDVTVELQLKNDRIVSMVVSYTTIKGFVANITATMTY